MKNIHIKTSEAVSEGHPDKVCDNISDAILDQYLSKDSKSKVACETFVTTNKVVVGGEITSRAEVDIDKTIKDVVRKIGYTEKGLGFSCDEIKIDNYLHTQSLDIKMGVEDNSFNTLGAGDQGIMFGYACKDTPSYLPLAYKMALDLLSYASKLRKSDKNSILKPDSKSQVTIKYEDNKPVSIEDILVSHQHSDIQSDKVREYIKEEIIDKVFKDNPLYNKNTRILINPTGRFVIGGPTGDSGVTGRKIIVDTYGGFAHHGGGAFSGKDPSKVDRSAAYMARYVAKNLVANNFCDQCEIQLSYAIGIPQPISIDVETFGTKKTNVDITKFVEDTFDFRPQAIIDTLNLTKIRYSDFVNYGHFNHSSAPWEQIISL